MDRRTFLASAAGSVLAAPLAAETQQTGKVARIGVLSSFGGGLDRSGQPFLQRLRELGWVRGQNLTLEFRYAEGNLSRLPDLATELVQLKMDAILAVGTPASLAAQRATRATPIVAIASDPAGTGLVASVARPGGNVTALATDTGLEVVTKRLELLKDAVPKASRVGVLWNPTNPPEARLREPLTKAARALGLSLGFVGVTHPGDFIDALTGVTHDRADALLITENSLNTEYRTLIVDYATKHKLPTVFGDRVSVQSGGLMSYGADFSELLKRAAVYLDKILKDTRPADLPVEQPTKFELVVNLKTAKALGLTIPPSLLLRVDEVIQ